jgi:hypothetical protein
MIALTVIETAGAMLALQAGLSAGAGTRAGLPGRAAIRAAMPARLSAEQRAARRAWNAPLPRAWSYSPPRDSAGRLVIDGFLDYSDYRAEWIMNGTPDAFEVMLKKVKL